MDIAKEIFTIIGSWPIVAIVALLVLRKPIRLLVERLVVSETGKAKVGPVEIELGKIAEEGKQAINDLNRISYLMAESRLLELEITESNFGPVFTEKQRERMKRQIQELEGLTRATRQDSELVPAKK